MNFRTFVDEIRGNRWNVFGVEVYEGGELTHRWGDTEENRHPIYSAAKTITSIAVGMAVDEGKMDINRSLLEYLSGGTVEKMARTQRRRYEEITVKRLLTMSVSGYPFRVTGESWLDAALGYEIDAEKREFEYSNVSAYLAGVAAANAVGGNLYEYLRRKLFEPLGIEEPPHMMCPDGYFYGASAMELTVNELSRIGLMLYQGGVYEGRRILSEKYVREATSVQQMNREGGYGYFIWKYRNGFSINGKWGQKCYILPEEKLMVTYLSHIEEKCPELRESMERNLMSVEPAGY